MHAAPVDAQVAPLAHGLKAHPSAMLNCTLEKMAAFAVGYTRTRYTPVAKRTPRSGRHTYGELVRSVAVSTGNGDVEEYTLMITLVPAVVTAQPMVTFCPTPLSPPPAWPTTAVTLLMGAAHVVPEKPLGQVHEPTPALLTHVPPFMHTTCPFRHGLVLHGVEPVPDTDPYPAGHTEHVRLPTVLVQFVSESQPPFVVAHSLTSAQVKPLPV